MGTNKLEQEAKFWLSDPAKLEQNLKSLGARLVQPRTHELNLRFDTPDGRLSSAFQALRLRQDQKARLTYKDAADPASAVSSRTEIEVEVGDLQTAREILEALGYRVVVSMKNTERLTNWGMWKYRWMRCPLAISAKSRGRTKPASIQPRRNWG